MSEWIDVNDRLPDGWNNVLAYTENNGCIIAHHDDTWRSRSDRPLRVTVTHWMPLPAPPAPKKSRKPEFRNCRDCDYWKSGGNSDGTITRVCDFPRSPKFLERTTAEDGCTPRKRAKEGWI